MTETIPEAKAFVAVNRLHFYLQINYVQQYFFLSIWESLLSNSAVAEIATAETKFCTDVK